MMWAQRQRIEMISRVKAIIIKMHNQGLGTDKEKLIALLCTDFGVARRKAQEYISELKFSGFVEEDLGSLFLSKNEIKKLEESKKLSEEEENILKNDSSIKG